MLIFSASFLLLEAIIFITMDRHFSQDVPNPSFQLPLLYRSACPLARGNRITPCHAPIQDYGPGGGVEEPILDE